MGKNKKEAKRNKSKQLKQNEARQIKFLSIFVPGQCPSEWVDGGTGTNVERGKVVLYELQYNNLIHFVVGVKFFVS
jgi:hypothetical protein